MYLPNYHRGQGGVAKSEDGCDTWRLTNKGLPVNAVTTHIVMDPSSPAGKRTLYATVYEKGVYKSTDDGENWFMASEGITENMNVWQMVFCPKNDKNPSDILYMITARGQQRRAFVPGALYVSTNGAENWKRLNLPEGVNAPNALAADPRDPKRLYLACWPYMAEGREVCGGVYRSDDGGQSWRCIFNPEAHVFGIEIDHFDADTIYINTFDHAAYFSKDAGASFKRMKGYNFHWGHRVHADPRNEGYVFLTTFGSSVWHGKVQDAGDSWEDVKPFPNLTRWDARP
jgi:photosystem II stability/assembly factor-like uncharacterized protein